MAGIRELVIRTGCTRCPTSCTGPEGNRDPLQSCGAIGPVEAARFFAARDVSWAEPANPRVSDRANPAPHAGGLASQGTHRHACMPHADPKHAAEPKRFCRCAAQPRQRLPEACRPRRVAPARCVAATPRGGECPCPDHRTETHTSTYSTRCTTAANLDVGPGRRVGFPTLLFAGARRGHCCPAHAQTHRPHLLAATCGSAITTKINGLITDCRAKTRATARQARWATYAIRLAQ